MVKFLVVRFSSIGDIILTTAQDIRLPACLVVGTVTDVRTDPDNPLLYQLDVTPAIDPRDLRTVYVVDPDTGSES